MIDSRNHGPQERPGGLPLESAWCESRRAYSILSDQQRPEMGTARKSCEKFSSMLPEGLRCMITGT